MSWSRIVFRVGGLPLAAAFLSFFSLINSAGAGSLSPSDPLAIAPARELPEAWLPSAEKLALAALLAEDETVVVREEGGGSVMGTVAKNTAYGAIAGALVGGAIYLLDDDDDDAIEIAYWAAGGALLGAAVGVVQALVDESQAAATVSKRGGLANPAPTVMVPVLRLGM